jgi:5-methylcytosine-specific restriction endonuclease McrA
VNSTTQVVAPNKYAVLHSRLLDGPQWLAGLLRYTSPAGIDDSETSYVLAKIHEYADEAAEDEAVRPIAELLRSELLQQFDDWRHHVTRLQYQSYLRSDGWERTRIKVLERADYTCEACGGRRATQVHHVTYDDPRGEELLWNLKAVCAECHEKITAREKARGK